jgi:hypothetical protein
LQYAKKEEKLIDSTKKKTEKPLNGLVNVFVDEIESSGWLKAIYKTE